MSVIIESLPTAGTLNLNNVPVSLFSEISAADISAGLLTFTPDTNVNGDNYASFSFRVRDDGGTTNGGFDAAFLPNTITFDVVPSNDPPSGANKSITINEDATYTVVANDFGFADPIEGNVLQSVRITTLPALGSLRLNNVPVTLNQDITVANINSGLLRFTPATNGNGTNYASFAFRVRDNGGTLNSGIDLAQRPIRLASTSLLLMMYRR